MRYEHGAEIVLLVYVGWKACGDISHGARVRWDGAQATARRARRWFVPAGEGERAQEVEEDEASAGVLVSGETPFKAGELIYITDGEYSDYRVKGVYRVKKDFDPKKLGARWTALRERRVPARTGTYLMFLEGEGLIEEVDAREYSIEDVH
jgi:hypothetical protein